MAVPAKKMAGKASRARRSTKAGFATGTSEQISRAKDGEQVTPEQIRATEESFDKDVEQERSKQRNIGAKQQRRKTFSKRAYEGIAGYEVGGVSLEDGAGLILGFMAWVVVLRYIKDGPQGVRDLLKAKFLNKGPDGKELP